MATKKPAKSVKKLKTSWYGKVLNSRYGKPAVFVVAFMVLGVGALWWASAATTTYSLWSNSTVPKTSSVSDASDIELGVRFQSSVAGYVTGVKFYKGAQNTGGHTGNLWDSKGKLLASVKFTSETSSGWQTATFATPISIAANVPYIISYHAPNGHYALNGRYFRSAHTKNYLTAPANSASTPNGVYAKGAGSSLYPSTSGAGANYWVDVLFATKLLDAQPGPAAPTNVSAQLNGTSVDVTWNPSVSANTVSQYNVYRNGNKVATVSGTVFTYTDNTVAAGNTYSYQVQAVDSTNATSALSTAVSVTVPASSGGGTTGSSTCPLPAYPTPSCTGLPSGTQFTKTVSGDFAATTPGLVIDGWHITGDLVIQASNITVKNSQIDGTVNNEVGSTHYTPFTITDTTIGPAAGCIVAPGLGEAGYTAQRVLIRGHDDGFRMSGNDVNVSDSYAKLCYVDATQSPPDGSHSDGIQAYCPSSACSGLVFNHNTIDARGIPATFMLNLVDPNLSTVSANDNLLAGGAYTIVSYWHSGSNWTFSNNRVVDKSWSYGPASAEGTCSHQVWSGNSLVNIDSSYAVTGTVADLGCIQ